MRAVRPTVSRLVTRLIEWDIYVILKWAKQGTKTQDYGKQAGRQRSKRPWRALLGVLGQRIDTFLLQGAHAILELHRLVEPSGKFCVGWHDLSL